MSLSSEAQFSDYHRAVVEKFQAHIPAEMEVVHVDTLRVLYNWSKTVATDEDTSSLSGSERLVYVLKQVYGEDMKLRQLPDDPNSKVNDFQWRKGKPGEVAPHTSPYVVLVPKVEDRRAA